MITKKQYEDALAIVNEYSNNIKNISVSKNLHIWEVGCKVKLTESGIKTFGKMFSKKEATVLNYLSWYKDSKTDGLLNIMWDGSKRPDTFHISYFEKVKL